MKLEVFIFGNKVGELELRRKRNKEKKFFMQLFYEYYIFQLNYKSILMKIILSK